MMKPRRKQPAVTRRAILGAAGKGFARGGVSATGIGAIVAEAGMTKGALFHHFADKRTLVLAWIDESLAPAVQEAWQVPMAGIDSLAALIAWLRTMCATLDRDDPLSVLVAVAAEQGVVDEDIRSRLCGVLDGWRDSLAGVLQRGQADGWVHRSIQPTVEAGILVAMFSGMAVVVRCAAAGASGNDAAKAVEAYLETLRPG